MMKIAYIMRGVPGSGKSTVAKILASEIGRIHSTDDLFIVDGEYRFDLERLPENHEHNFKMFCNSLNEGIPIVICDNTNTKRWEFERYVHAATQADYFVAFVLLPHSEPELASQRSIHKVPVETIRQMITEWEN